MATLLNHHIDGDVAKAFATYATLLVLKMTLMGPLTAFHRLTKKAFANPEDTRLVSPAEAPRFVRVDPGVERVRRCHQNDLENVVPFVLVGLLYSLTGPDLAAALLYFRLFAASRLCHTAAYLLPLPQPSRALSWVTGVGVTFCMAYRVLTVTCYF